MKKFLGILLAVLLVFSLGVPAVMADNGDDYYGNGYGYYNGDDNGYDDNNGYDDDGYYDGNDYYDDYYYDDYENGYDDYYGEAEFDIWDLVPEVFWADLGTNTTRAEFAALAVMLYELIAGEEIVGWVEFYDTDDINVWKAAYIEVVMGIGDGIFAPDAYITREQAAVMVVRLANAVGAPLPVAGYAEFADADDISGWAVDAVNRVRTGDIMIGIGGGMFDPQGSFARWESIDTIVMLYYWITSATEEYEYNGYEYEYVYEDEHEYNGDVDEYSNGDDEYEENGYGDEYNDEEDEYNGDGEYYYNGDDASGSDDEYNGEE